MIINDINGHAKICPNRGMLQKKSTHSRKRDMLKRSVGQLIESMKWKIMELRMSFWHINLCPFISTHNLDANQSSLSFNMCKKLLTENNADSCRQSADKSPVVISLVCIEGWHHSEKLLVNHSQAAPSMHLTLCVKKEWR